MKPASAILTGVALSALLVVIGTLIASALLLPPRVDWALHMPGPAYLAATLGVSFGAAVLGGFVAAHFASAHRLRAAAVVAAVLALLELLSFVCPFTGQPPFFLWLVPLLAAAGALAGGGARALAR